MIYDTKGEFIQALKDYKKYIEIANKWKHEYQDLYYLRYEKVKSPLDYDIVGYKNGEAIRQIKGRGVLTDEMLHATQEKIEERMEYCLERYTEVKKKAENADIELSNIKLPLREILVQRYKNGVKLKVLSQSTNLYLDEAGLHKYIMRGLDKYYENK